MGSINRVKISIVSTAKRDWTTKWSSKEPQAIYDDTNLIDEGTSIKKEEVQGALIRFICHAKNAKDKKPWFIFSDHWS